MGWSEDKWVAGGPEVWLLGMVAWLTPSLTGPFFRARPEDLLSMCSPLTDRPGVTLYYIKVADSNLK